MVTTYSRALRFPMYRADTISVSTCLTLYVTPCALSGEANGVNKVNRLNSRVYLIDGQVLGKTRSECISSIWQSNDNFFRPFNRSQAYQHIFFMITFLWKGTSCYVFGIYKHLSCYPSAFFSFRFGLSRSNSDRGTRIAMLIEHTKGNPEKVIWNY